MILVDDRTGSKELLQDIRARGVNADLARLTADFQFSGVDDRGDILVGVERKDIQDMLTCMRDHRLTGQQLQPMKDAYDRLFVVIEGPYKEGKDGGFVEVPIGGRWAIAKGSYRYGELEHHRMRLSDVGMESWRTFDSTETAAYVVWLYKHYQQPWADRLRKVHKVYAPPPNLRTPGHRVKMFSRREPSLLEKVCAQLPGIDTRAQDVAARFKSVSELVSASEEEWTRRMKGLRIGKGIARNIVQSLKGE